MSVSHKETRYSILQEDLELYLWQYLILSASTSMFAVNASGAGALRASRVYCVAPAGRIVRSVRLEGGNHKHGDPPGGPANGWMQEFTNFWF